MSDPLVLAVPVLNKHLPACVIRTALGLDVSDGHVFVGSFFFGPIARTLAVAELGEHHDDGDALLADHSPEVRDRAFDGVLRDDEGLGVVVALDERRVDVRRVLLARQRGQDHSVPVVGDHGVAAVLLAVFLTTADRARLPVLVRVLDVLQNKTFAQIDRGFIKG